MTGKKVKLLSAKAARARVFNALNVQTFRDTEMYDETVVLELIERITKDDRQTKIDDAFEGLMLNPESVKTQNAHSQSSVAQNAHSKMTTKAFCELYKVSKEDFASAVRLEMLPGTVVVGDVRYFVRDVTSVETAAFIKKFCRPA